MSLTERAIYTLAAIADHRYTILAGWLSPAVVLLVAPETLHSPFLLGLILLFLVFLLSQQERDRREFERDE